MSPQDIISKYNGQHHVGVNAVDSGQCVGLFEKVIADMGLGFVPGNAKDLFANADPNKFQKVVNNPNDANQLPPQGAWFVFGAEPWNFMLGHVGMVISSEPTSFVGLEQNNPAGDDQVREMTHTGSLPYAGMIGWLIPHGTTAPTPTAPGPVAPQASGWATALRTCNVRATPGTNSQITSVLAAGSRFQYQGVVTGEVVSGNGTWVHSTLGHYVWSGNVVLG